MTFKDKTVIVTGGAQGIGRCLSLRFAEQGARVVMADIDPAAGLETESELRGKGLDAVFFEADMGVPSAIEALARKAPGPNGRIDVLVNNAGIGDLKPLADRTVEEWDRIINVNLRGSYLCARACAPFMPEGSSIISISSTRALQSEKNTEPYAASKAGILGLTHSLAVSLADRRIRVNCVSPGWIETAEWQKSSKRKAPKHSEADRLQHPAGRVGVPDDIASVCLFLADGGKAGFITGQNFVVDGGMTRKMIYVE
jgi:NAD(P)-dependent dehydrogenase (short-subunit alcohol dehydrogenase family)